MRRIASRRPSSDTALGNHEGRLRSNERRPPGRWIYADGQSRRGRFYPYGFLVDTSNGRYVSRPEPDAEHPYTVYDYTPNRSR